MAVAITQDEAARESWLRERRKGIGASEVGTILGINPHDSAYDLWLRKTGQIPPKDETLAMWLGHEMEPIIAKRYELETGRRLHNPGDFTILAHPAYPWLRCTLDRTTCFEDGQHGPVELKAPGSRMAEDWSEAGGPIVYEAQLQIQMACSGAKTGELAALVGNEAFHVIRYERNDAFIDSVIPVLHEFWQCVQNGEEPAIDGSEATAKALRKLHPMDNGETIQLPDEFVDVIQEWEDLKAMRKGIEDKIRLVENQLKAALGENTFGVVDGMKLSHKAQTRRAYEVPETTFRVLRKVGK